jgi:hypothetical protein
MARKVSGSRPVLAAVLITPWILLAVSLTAVTTAFLLWVAVFLPDVLTGEESRVKAVSAALLGAATTYFAFLWTKEIQESGGPFAPGIAFKALLERAFENHPRVPERTTLAYSAIYDDRMSDGTTGWSGSQRRKRARIIADHLATSAVGKRS